MKVGLSRDRSAANWLYGMPLLDIKAPALKLTDMLLVDRSPATELVQIKI